MLLSKQVKLTDDSTFRKVVLLTMGYVIKTTLDALTSSDPDKGVKSLGDEKILAWCQEKGRSGSIQDHSQAKLLADKTYVGGILTMFDPTDKTEGFKEITENNSKKIDADDAFTKVLEKINTNGYIALLAKATLEDFLKTEKDSAGNWIEPSVL